MSGARRLFLYTMSLPPFIAKADTEFAERFAVAT